MIVTLPEPPSINHYWRVSRGITHLSKDGRRWKNAAHEIARTAGLVVLEGPVSVSITWYRSRRSGDLDNRIKVVLDVLRGLAYVDDKQVVELHAWRYDDKANPRVEVTVGKGDSPRPVDATKYRENWDRIFAKVTEAGQHYRDALDELTQLSQEMGMYPAIDEHGHQDLA